jgi:hypothetical protein
VRQILAAIGRAAGREVAMAAPACRVPGETMSSFCGWQADIPALRRIHPELLDFDTHFRDLQPPFCSIYDPAFWRHERFWKVPALSYIQVFNGTPFKNVVWRLLGVRLGRCVFDDGASMTERTLVTIGDHCTATRPERFTRTITLLLGLRCSLPGSAQEGEVL